MPTSQGTRWCFTINNPTDDDHQSVADLFDNRDLVKYGIVGREVGESGTPHLQCFVIFNRNKRFNALRRLLPRAHFELTRGNSQQAADYCKKDGDFDEHGTFPGRQGHRADLDALIQWGDEFETDNGRPPTSPEVARSQPQAYLKYPRIVRLFNARANPPEIRQGEPNEWQGELAAELDEPANDRSIVFYVDPDGGKGKTWFQQWYLTKHPDRAQVLSVGKRDDLAFSIDESKQVFFFNIPRGGMEFLQYVILESIKDQMIYSPKYTSRLKILRHKAHVIVFSNEQPDESKMSSDRYVIREL